MRLPFKIPMLGCMALSLALATAMSCSRQSASGPGAGSVPADCVAGKSAALAEAIDSALSGTKGQVGVALLTSEGDTLVAGADARFPLMSVFKLHEAIAVARALDSRGQDLDTLLRISRADLNPDTWSPMLKDYPEGDITMSVRDLMGYLLIHSDNNASNILFDRIVPVTATDSVVKALVPVREFALRHTEAEMAVDHESAYDNWSSPLACAVVIDRVFTDSLVSAPKQEAIKSLLGMCESAPGRIAAALGKEARLYHRTGSGYTNSRGEIAAVNDVAWVSLPDGRHYALAILVKDYPGPQDEADSQIARIASAIHRSLTR